MDEAPPLDDMLQLLRSTLGSGVEIFSWRVANRQTDYWVLLARLRRPSLQVVVKLAGPNARMDCSFERSVYLQRLVRERTSIPMPDILAADASRRESPWRWMVKTRLPGQEWAAVRRRMTPGEQSAAFRQLGEAVAQLHGMRFPAFGELDPQGNVSAAGSYLRALEERARRRLPGGRLRELFFSALEPRAALFHGVQDACLCHEDLHHGNILFQRRQGEWRLATILDFDKAWAGHAEIDLARLDLWRGMMSPEFRQAYLEMHQPDARYEQRRPLHQLLWCLEFARNTLQHLEDTRRVCTELGLPPLANFD